MQGLLDEQETQALSDDNMSAGQPTRAQTAAGQAHISCPGSHLRAVPSISGSWAWAALW